MQFTKIKFRKNEGVELSYVRKGEGGETEARQFTCAQPPRAELPAALQAFRQFVVDLLPLRNEEKKNDEGGPAGLELDDLVVTTLSMDEEPKTKKIGLIVTAILPIEKASGRPLVLNTPRMREWEDNGDPQPAGTFGDDITKLIAAAQSAARAYYKGERGQVEMFAEKETTAAAAPAEPSTNGTDPAQPPKVRRQRRVKEIEGAGQVFNPEATRPPTDQEIAKQLAISGFIVPAERVAKWVSSEREEALKWAQDPEGRAAPYWVRRDMETQELATSAGD